jgi:hypothetical protein
MDHGDPRTASGTDAEVDFALLMDALVQTSYAVDLFANYQDGDKSDALKKAGRDRIRTTKARSRQLRHRLEELERQLDHS